MKKLLFIFGLSAAMVACTNNPSENTTKEEVKEEHSHEGDHDHDHENDENLAISVEERIAPVEGATVFFVSLEDGATVSSPVKVEMGVDGMGVKPAGEIELGSGHHHILINNAEGFIASGSVVPMNETNIHFGKGQTETELELAPGTYTISLQFANALHESYGEQMSKTITITVE